MFTYICVDCTPDLQNYRYKSVGMVILCSQYGLRDVDNNRQTILDGHIGQDRPQAQMQLFANPIANGVLSITMFHH